MPANRTRKDKKVLRGTLTQRLVTPDGIHEALHVLLTKVDQYLLVVQRSRYSKTGEDQSPGLLFTEIEPADLDKDIATHLSNAKRALVILRTNDPDVGVGSLDLTTRKWESLIENERLNEALIEFNDTLAKHSKARWFTYGWAWTAFFAPIIISFVAYIGGILFDPALRSQIFSGRQEIAYPAWLESITFRAGELWPVFIAIGLIIIVIVAQSGALRVWPQKLTRKAFVTAAYRIRASNFLARNASTLLGSVLAAAISALITVWLTR